jgi:hypothetical protein
MTYFTSAKIEIFHLIRYKQITDKNTNFKDTL